MEAQEKLEVALGRLQLLFDGEVNDEQSYQNWFEENEIVFTVLGYIRVIPHPRLTNADGSELGIPDFLCQKPDGIWEIFELKRPDTKILRDRESRPTFYAGLNEYCSQCYKYARFFDDSANRKRFFDEYSVTVQPNLKSVIIAGSSEHLNRQEVHQMLMERGSRIELQTFDDVQETLELHRQTFFAESENAAGFSIGIVCAPSLPNGSKGYIFDLGRDPSRNRISVYVTREREFVFTVIDSLSKAQSVKLTSADFDFFSRSYYSMEVALADGYTYLSLKVDGRRIQNIKLNDMFLEMDGLINPVTKKISCVLGCDMTKNNFACVKIYHVTVYNRTLDFWQQYQNTKYFIFHQYERPMLNLIGDGEYASTDSLPISS